MKKFVFFLAVVPFPLLSKKDKQVITCICENGEEEVVQKTRKRKLNDDDAQKLCESECAALGKTCKAATCFKNGVK